MKYHIAEANFARMKAPLDDPLMMDFVLLLDEINAAADQSEGFVWRLQTEEGDATAIRVFEDDLILFNMSVWQSIEALYHYTYRSAHAEPFRNRTKWFEKLHRPTLVLWWIPKGHIPTIAEATEKFKIITESGPCPEAFTFKQRFPHPNPR